MSKELLKKAIPELGTVMFPGGAPVDSFYKVQNGMFRASGELFRGVVHHFFFSMKMCIRCFLTQMFILLY